MDDVAAAPGPRHASDGRRRRGRFALDRLSLRLGLGAALLVVLPLGAGFLVLAQRQYDRTIEARRVSADVEVRVIEAALRHRMVDKDPTLMAEVLKEIAAQPGVQGAMILDHDGEIRIASDPDQVGQRFAQDSPTCRGCHAHEPNERERWTILEGDAGGVLRTVRPIENGPACYGCHPEEDRLNGILMLDVSLDEVRHALAQDATWIVVVMGGLAIILLGGVGLLVRQMVLKRLLRLAQSVHSITAGDLDERTDVGGEDVVGSLAADFNIMAGSVQNLMARIRQQEARLENVVNSLDDGLVVLDRDSRIVTCNRSFGRRVGFAPDRANGEFCHAVGKDTLPCCRGDTACPAELCVSTGVVQRAVFSEEDEEDGSPGRVAEVYASPVFDAGGAVVNVVEIWRDITERVREEERLGEIERLVSLGVLASGFSHEVNTPLATMLTCAESVLGRMDDSRETGSEDGLFDAVRESATIIRDQVLRCRRITEQFLRFSRGVPPSIEPLDLRTNIEEVVALVQPTAREAGVRIRVEDGDALPMVRANTEVVRHVLLNLLVNAIQSCEGARRGGEIEVEFAVGEDVCVRIRDAGCGIAPEDRRHLFEPFRSKKAQGTGLGLFLSRSFMRRFGGDVRLLESELEFGSCFEVAFARAAVETV